MSTSPLPLAGVTVLDFSTLLPGPLCTLLLAEAGADVLKIERPGTGDPMRGYPPRAGGESGIRFVVLNRGKRSLTLDLKDPGDRDYALSLAHQADVLVEQFRPGVMDRLGLGYDAVAAENPGAVYCSITGYGHSGPLRSAAGHDLNYAATAGLLSLVADGDGNPVLPASTFADIGAGAYPAFMNIALALLARHRTGAGAHLDIAMTENMLPFAYWGFANGSLGQWPTVNGELLTGGSARYAVYRTADGEHLAVAAVEEPFWQRFCDAIGLDPGLRDDTADPAATRQAVAAIIGRRTLADWEGLTTSEDTCVTVVHTVQQARAHAHFDERQVFSRTVASPDGDVFEAAHVPIAPPLRDPRPQRPTAGLNRDRRPDRLADFFTDDD